MIVAAAVVDGIESCMCMSWDQCERYLKSLINHKRELQRVKITKIELITTNECTSTVWTTNEVNCFI